MSESPFITRVVLEDFKSIHSCDVSLGPLTFLVGPNGSGKSNFLSALRFVSNALHVSLDYALVAGGSAQAVTRVSSPPSSGFGIRLEFQLRNARHGHYAFRLGAVRSQDGRLTGAYRVEREECVIKMNGQISHFKLIDGVIVSSLMPTPPATAHDRLFLVVMSGFSGFSAVYEALAGMEFYDLDPARMRFIEATYPGHRLMRDGSNIRSVLAAMGETGIERAGEYLAAVVPYVRRIIVKQDVEGRDILSFGHYNSQEDHEFFLGPYAMSDGTLRCLGTIVALLQSSFIPDSRLSLIGLEEPETLLHPAATAVLLGCLRNASANTQVIVTSHSPELLDDKELDSNCILAVSADEGATKIGPIDEAGRSVLRDRLFTAGELLRMNQLIPDPRQFQPIATEHPRLFDEIPR